MQTRSKTYQIVGNAILNYALQAGKPHHLAARWNFVNFQTPSYSAILMEYTTPQSYGKTSVSFGGIAKDGEIVVAGNTAVKHVQSKQESENDWPEPTVVSWQWTGENGGKQVVGSIDGELPERTDRVDVLAHLPGFVKSFISGATGLKPHIFQVSHSLYMFSPLNAAMLISGPSTVCLQRYPDPQIKDWRRRGLGDWTAVYRSDLYFLTRRHAWYEHCPESSHIDWTTGYTKHWI